MMGFAAFVGTAVIALPTGGAPPETLRYDVFLGEARIGQSLTLRASEPGDSVLRQTEILDVVLSRGGERLSLGQTTTTREDAKGQLLSYEVESVGMGPRPWRDRLRRIPEGWERSRDRGQGPRVDTLPPADLRGPAGIEGGLIALGDSIAFESVDEGSLEPHAYLARPLSGSAPSPPNLPDGSRGFELLDRRTGQSVREWLEAGGRLLAAEDPAIGWRIERAGPGRDASGQSPRTQAQGDLDLFEWRKIPFRGVPPASGACELLVHFSDLDATAVGSAAAAPSLAVAIPEGPGQTVRPGDAAGSLRVRIDPTSAPATSEDARAAWRSDPALAGSLRPGVTIDADHAEVRAFAAAVCEGARSPTEEALRLEKAVHDRIEEDDLKTVFATASQTLVSRSGDCTEHAVLLTACLRARGIPARLVAGLVPIGPTMLYHLWSEAYLGTWVALDATIGDSRTHPCAIALSRWAQPEDGLAEFQIAMARLGGTVRVEVVSPP